MGACLHAALQTHGQYGGALLRSSPQGWKLLPMLLTNSCQAFAGDYTIYVCLPS